MADTIEFMELLLLLEAEAQSLVSGKNRSYERALKEELSKIFEEAELLFGPRDRSYKLLEPRITEKYYAQPAVYVTRKIRIYLTSHAKIARYMAAYELSHEAIHCLSPVSRNEAPTILEEGLATYFSFKYVKRVYGAQFRTTGDRHYDAAYRAVCKLMARNEFVIKELRLRQPVISRIDAKLLVEVAGIEPELATFLCRDFPNYRQPPISWSALANQHTQLFARGLQSFWELWEPEPKA